MHSDGPALRVSWSTRRVNTIINATTSTHCSPRNWNIKSADTRSVLSPFNAQPYPHPLRSQVTSRSVLWLSLQSCGAGVYRFNRPPSSRALHERIPHERVRHGPRRRWAIGNRQSGQALVGYHNIGTLHPAAESTRRRKVEDSAERTASRYNISTSCPSPTHCV
jgi:hypothetical protein